MATESSAKRTTFEDMMLTLFGLLLLGQIFQNIPMLLEEHLGITIGSGARDGVLIAGAEVNASTPIGSRVSTPNGSPFYTVAFNEDTQAGTFPPGASLVLTDGPVEDPDGNRWWYAMDSASGDAGWVPESALVREGVGGINAQTQLGTRARALVDANMWRSPEAMMLAGAMRMGEWGVLRDGPRLRNGVRWWFFDRGKGDEDGWVPESALTLFSERGWRTGSPVVATRSMDMYERAGGGQIVGFIYEKDTARIVGGPVMIGNDFWWLVETEDGTQGWVPESGLKDGGIKGWLRSLVTILLIIGVIITVGLVTAIVYVTVRTNQIRAREAQRIKAAIPKAMQPKRNERWDKVLDHVSSDNPNDWRLAIIEADIMLDEVVTRMGYQGATLGDRLKQVTRGDLRTLDAAWEAHRVRNQIAHEGSDYILTQREARRVVELYGSVFEELRYI